MQHMPHQKKRLVSERIDSIRRRGLTSSRGILVKETTRQSLAREFFVRTKVIPFFKHELGKDFLALTIHGSVQLGVRKATEKRTPVDGAHNSDVDIGVCISEKQGLSPRKKSFRQEEYGEILSTLGFRSHVFVFNEREFVNHCAFEVMNSRPFHILYGKDILAHADKYVPGIKINLDELPKIRKEYTHGKYFQR